MPSKRDPRVDPRPGDVLMRGSTYRQVRTYKRGVTFWHRFGCLRWDLGRESHEEWRLWAKSAEVVHVAE